MATAQIVALSMQKRSRIINRYMDLSQQLAKIKTEMEILKVEAVDVLGEGVHETKSARVTITWASRTTFDSAKAKTFLKPAQVEACQRTANFYDVRVKAL